jgi:hypothetical protein
MAWVGYLLYQAITSQNLATKKGSSRPLKQQPTEPKVHYQFQSVTRLSASFTATLGWGVDIVGICAIAT